MSGKTLKRGWGLWLMPGVILVVFTAGVTSTWVRAQDPTVVTLAIETAQLQRQISDLGDVPAQMSVLRERTTVLEGLSKEHSKKLDSIETKENWIVFGVFGSLLTLFFRRLLPTAGDVDTAKERLSFHSPESPGPPI